MASTSLMVANAPAQAALIGDTVGGQLEITPSGTFVTPVAIKVCETIRVELNTLYQGKGDDTPAKSAATSLDGARTSNFGTIE